MRILTTVALCALLSANAAAQEQPEAGKPFTINGEQVTLPVPKFWKLAWMEGTPDGANVLEYIPPDEDIKSWRGGYLQISRSAYPAPELLAQLEQAKANITDVALAQNTRDAAKGCGGKYQAMPQHALTFNNVRFAVGGGFCDLYGPAAPLGEGAFVAFIQGKDYLFRIHYGWRPATPEEQKSHLPWRITPAASLRYLESIKAATLCGGKDQAACPAR
ncbi:MULTISPECIES: hypothetical protein [unclassified Duganella]|uniref:hypothetical protein n=1 Tax=unclassified Duganella TaxID=2636909 RepID=UPI000888B1A6|nr:MULTISPECIES: hypothetical protein [unclassified Duganella]SDG37429.1 hypothetical protein SAMN05216320_104105 [Duganella sp. OV458]SDJ66240.1 hypothetical protein SAMN05428973_105299 [Duganella sp. OV510]